MKKNDSAGQAGALKMILACDDQSPTSRASCAFGRGECSSYKREVLLSDESCFPSGDRVSTSPRPTGGDDV
jgi:hypothetical protein